MQKRRIIQVAVKQQQVKMESSADLGWPTLLLQETLLQRLEQSTYIDVIRSYEFRTVFYRVVFAMLHELRLPGHLHMLGPIVWDANVRNRSAKCCQL